MNALDRIKKIPLYGQTNIQTVIVMASDWLAGPYCKEAAAELEAMTEKLESYDDYYRRVISEECAPDEQHCTCVPALRKRIAELEKACDKVLVAWSDLNRPLSASMRDKVDRDLYGAMEALRTARAAALKGEK